MINIFFTNLLSPPNLYYNSHYEKFADGTVKCIDDEIPFDIPESWCWSRFSNIVNQNPNVQTEDDNDVAFMPMAYIEAGYSGEYTYEVKKWTEVKKGFTKISKGDIAYAKITPCFQNRKSFILGDVPSNVAAATTELNVLRIYENTLSAWFVLFFLKTDYFIKEAKLKGTAGQQRVIPEYVQNKLFPIAPLSEQNRIVSRIKDLLTIIERYEQSKIELDKLESELQPQLKKSILQYAIQGKLVAQNATDEPASELLKRINEEKEQLIKDGKIKRDKNTSIIFKGDDNKYFEKKGNDVISIDDEIPFEIPDSWEWVPICTLLQIQTGASFKKEEANNNQTGVRILRGGNILPSKYSFKKDDIFINKQLVPESILLKKDDLITPAVTSIENVGKMARITQDYENVSAGGFVFILRLFAKSSITAQYLCYAIQAPVITEKIKTITKKSGSAFYNIGKERLSAIKIPLPPLQEQKRIVKALDNVLASH